MKLRFLLPIYLVFLSYLCCAQDIHFTQHYNTPQAVSPALTGIFNGDQRFLAAYRGQWYVADAPYTTFHGAFDQKYYSRKLKKSFMGYGGSIFYDRAGDSRLSHMVINLSGSYSYLIDPENVITGGLMIGLGQRSFNFDDLTWANQYSAYQFEPTNDPRENTLNENGGIYPDFALGINYRAQKAKNDNNKRNRSRLDIGAAIHHLHRPNQSFSDQGESVLQPRANVYLNQLLQVNKDLDLYWNGLAQFQDKYFEGIVGAGGRFHLSHRRGRELAVQAGLAWRLNEISDAAILAAELHYQYWKFGFSYDFNVSQYRVASNRFGGPEVTLSYVIHFVDPVPVFRICPII